MTKTGNLNFEYIHSGLQTEGYFYDNYFDDGAIMRDQERVKYVEARHNCSTVSGSKRRYEMMAFSILMSY